MEVTDISITAMSAFWDLSSAIMPVHLGGNDKDEDHGYDWTDVFRTKVKTLNLKLIINRCPRLRCHGLGIISFEKKVFSSAPPIFP